MKTKPMNVRLAFREEGPLWNVYLANAGTMANAKPVGSLAIGAVRRNESIKRDFMELMKRVLADAVEEMPDSWEERPAPEHERAGHS